MGWYSKPRPTRKQLKPSSRDIELTTDLVIAASSWKKNVTPTVSVVVALSFPAVNVSSLGVVENRLIYHDSMKMLGHLHSKKKDVAILSTQHRIDSRLLLLLFFFHSKRTSPGRWQTAIHCRNEVYHIHLNGCRICCYSGSNNSGLLKSGPLLPSV